MKYMLLIYGEENFTSMDPEAFAELVRRDGTVADILPELGVLVVYATVLLLLASWRLRAVLTRP